MEGLSVAKKKKKGKFLQVVVPFFARCLCCLLEKRGDSKFFMTDLHPAVPLEIIARSDERRMLCRDLFME